MSVGDNVAPDMRGNPGSIKWINDDDVKRLLTWDVLIEKVRESMIAFSLGPDHPQGAIQPLRTKIPIQDKGLMMVMPGLLKEQGALATKILTLFSGNAAKNISTHHSLVFLLEAETGIPAAIIDGKVLTEMRTAAASAVATIKLVKKKKDLVIAVLGAGNQGHSHAQVMAHVFKDCKIRVWSRRVESSRALVAALESEGIKAEVSTSVEDAVKGADVINTCTMASSPILKADWVKNGAHINSVGAPRPDWQELEEGLVREATVYADSKEAALKEAGDIIVSGASVFAEIGEVILGSQPVQKTNNNITIFKSLGLAVEDAVSARLVFDLVAQEKQH